MDQIEQDSILKRQNDQLKILVIGKCLEKLFHNAKEFELSHVDEEYKLPTPEEFRKWLDQQMEDELVNLMVETHEHN